MSLIRELADVPERLQESAEMLTDLLREHEIKSMRALVGALRSDPEFRSRWTSIWASVASAEGGKISLTTFGVVAGAALGGVDIAMAGSAFGLPLALVLGLAGLVFGTEMDSVRRASGSTTLIMRIPKELDARIKAAADLAGVKPRALIVDALSTQFPPDLDKEADR